MNQEAKQKWIEALKSKSYTKIKGRLKGENQGEFCALGVLADVYNREHPNCAVKITNRQHFLPKLVAKWASLPRTDQQLVAARNDGNGRCMSFKKLADLVDKKF